MDNMSYELKILLLEFILFVLGGIGVYAISGVNKIGRG